MLFSLVAVALVGSQHAANAYKIETAAFAGSEKPHRFFNPKRIARRNRGGRKAGPDLQHKIPVFTPSTTGASIPNEVFNLVKAIVGVGVLSLPAGTLWLLSFVALVRSLLTTVTAGSQ